MNKNYRPKIVSLFLVALTFGIYFVLQNLPETAATTVAQTTSPGSQTAFDQAAALAQLRERIKGKENEPAEKVFANIQMMKGVPAGRLLRIMEMGYAGSLGVNCAHCHTPEKWEADAKPQKQIAREMMAMTNTINSQLLKNIKNLKSAAPTVNCTTCHRGQVTPAQNLPPAGKTN